MDICVFVLKTRENNTIDKSIEHFKQQGVTLKVIDNHKKSVLYGRTKAYEECDNSFVSFIDDDDISLLTKDQIARYIELNKKAMYTNSYKQTRLGKFPLTLVTLKEWSLRNELSNKTKPHQSIIYDSSFAKDLVKRAGELILKHSWSTNTCDYVMRALVSTELGWHYEPDLTYVWDTNTSGSHLRQSMIYYDLKRYFFKV